MAHQRDTKVADQGILFSKESGLALSPKMKTTKEMEEGQQFWEKSNEVPLLKEEDEKSAEGVASKARTISAVGSCVMYVSCSTMMVLVNKWLASTLNINAHVSLLFMQNAVATIMVSLCRLFGIVKYPGFDYRIALKWLPVDLCFVAMLSTSFVAMRYLSVPMITVFKQLANLATVSGEFYLFGKPLSLGILVSFAVMISGAVLAAANDLAFSIPGYTWQLANCLSTSAYVLYLKYATQSIEVSKWAMVFYNNLLSLPLLLIIGILHGEPLVLYEAHQRGAIGYNFFVINAIAGTLGMFLNLASVWCVSATSATTYAVVGAFNKIPVTILGFLLFNTVITRNMAIYVCVSLAGGFMYSYEKLQQTKFSTK